MRRVRWSRRALNQLGDIFDYLSSKSPKAARRIVDRIRDTGEGLGRRAIGRPGPGGAYIKLVIGTRFLLVYDVGTGSTDDVEIVHVFHRAQNWTADLES